MNKVFSCSIGAPSFLKIFPVIRPGSLRFSKNPSPGAWVPPQKLNENDTFFREHFVREFAGHLWFTEND